MTPIAIFCLAAAVLFSGLRIGNAIDIHRLQLKEIMKWLIDKKVFDKEKKDKKTIL